MEKLQAALRMAREKRRTYAASPAKHVHFEPATDDWDDIERVEMNMKRLISKRVVSQGPLKDSNQFDILRTKVLLRMRANGWRRVAITSPTAGCGKTTIACNLALGLSRQSDTRTILYDFDLRRPMVGKLLELTPQFSNIDFLDGEVSFLEQALRPAENVAVSIATNPVADPTKYLLHAATNQALDQIDAAYKPDLMIFDMPPLLFSDDTRAFLKTVDCALLVVQAEKNTNSQIDTCEKEIAEYTNVLGVVLNQCRHADESTGYEYGY